MSKIAIPIALFFAFVFYGFKPGEPNSTEFISFIQQFNINHIWLDEHVIADGGRDTVERPKSMGSFSSRGYIMQTRFLNVIRDPKNSYLYMVFGKMKIGSDIVDFKGSMLIDEAKLYDESIAPQYKQGYVKGSFDFLIDKGQYAGDMSGRFESFFIWGANYQILYDGLNLGSDDYVNNIFTGKWVSSSKTKSVASFNFQDAVVRNQFKNKNYTAPSIPADRWWE